LATHRRHRRRPQPLRAPSSLSTLGQGHRRKLARPPDVAAVADPFTGVWIYDTNLSGWLVVGGTSVSTPVWAGIVNTAGRFNNSTAAELAQIYASASLFEAAPRGFADITSGACSIGPDFDGRLATEGWDFCTGVGSPLGYFGK